MEVLDIVVDGVKPLSTASTAEKDGYRRMSNQALPVFTQVISEPILAKVSKIDSPHAIWKYLRETFYRDIHFSFVHQLNELCLVSTKLYNRPISEFLDMFELQ